MLFSRGTGIDLVHRFFHIRRVVHSKEKGDGHSTARKRILRKLASHRITPHCRENKDQVTRSKSQNRSFEPHPIVRRTLRYRQTVRLIRTHDSGGKGTRGDEERERERERERAVVRSWLIGVATKYNENGWPVLFSSQSVSKRSEAQSLELSFLSGEKEIRTSGVRGLSRGPKGARWTYSARRVVNQRQAERR